MVDVNEFQNPDLFGLKRQKLISEREAILAKLESIETKLCALKKKRKKVLLYFIKNYFDKIQMQNNISFTISKEIKDREKKIQEEKGNVFENRKKIESLIDLTTQKIEENCKAEQQELRDFAELIKMLEELEKEERMVNEEIKYVIAERNRFYNAFKEIDIALNSPNRIDGIEIKW